MGMRRNLLTWGLAGPSTETFMTYVIPNSAHTFLDMASAWHPSTRLGRIRVGFGDSNSSFVMASLTVVPFSREDCREMTAGGGKTSRDLDSEAHIER